MRRKASFAAIAALSIGAFAATGAVTRIEITAVERLPSPAAQLPECEYLTGKVYFAVDPRLVANRIVADIDHAPRNAHGDVEFSADLQIIRPRSRARSNGTSLVEISNRGGKSLLYEFDLATPSFDPHSASSLGDGFLPEHGFTLVWIGWEFDVPARPAVLRSYLPVASDDGRTITGMVRAEWTGDQRLNVIPLGDKGQLGYPVVDASSTRNQLFVRDTVLGSRTPIPHDQWSFSDPTHVSLRGGFSPGRIYDVLYEAKDPPVAGLGMAAVRDFVSYLKFGGAASDAGLARSAKRALAFGVSQSGRFLREFLYDGFNADEGDRPVFDGVWAHVAGAGRGSFNERFAQPSRDGHEFNNVFYPVDLPPFSEESLLERAHRAHVIPKLFLTNGSYEYWSRCASLIHTTLDGRADAPPSSSTRVFFFSGSQHTVGSIPPHPAQGQNATNVNDYRSALRALLLAMQNWLTTGVEPPASRFPLLAQHELTTLDGLRFPSVKGVQLPRVKREAYRLDFSSQPPVAGPPFPTFVPQVDPDGNELGGIALPEVAVPLASYTGWNLRSAEIGADQHLLPFLGSWIPFARDERERRRTGDARVSIAQRYPSEQVYLQAIDQAGRRLAAAGFLLDSDLPSLHERAKQEWNYRASLAIH